MVELGSAHLGKNGEKAGGKPGDQKQTSIPDYTGEVSLRQYENDSALRKSQMWTSYVFRPISPQLASKLALKMISACNNPNLGYNQNSRDQVIQYGINSNTPINCDCSSLVRACVKEASGVDPGSFSTETEKSSLAATGLFKEKFKFVNLESTPLYAGDILVTINRGHTVIVTKSTSHRGDEVNAETSELESMDAGATPDMIGWYCGDFKPRTSAPILEPPPQPIYAKDNNGHSYIAGWTEDVRDLWYVPKSDMGYSIHSKVDSNTYIWDRFSEVMNHECSLGKATLGSLYKHTEDGYRRTIAASLGSVMCFTKPKNPGWAGIVEGIDPEGSIMLSYYDEHDNFKLKTLTKRYGVWDFDGYKFVGFIQNPSVGLLGVAESAKETFIRIAEEQVGTDSSWTFSNVDLSPNNGWSAAFVTACSAVAGSSLNIVIPNVVSCSAIGRVGTLRNMGEWFSGPAQDRHAVPEPGDIVLFRKSKNVKGMSIYDADHCGIVSKVNGGSFTVIEGDVNDSVQQHDYSTSSKMISGYFRPKWDIIDGTSDSVNQYRDIQGLYTNGVSINDAAARQVGYLDRNLKPSISPSKLKLSVINYTGLLGNMYSVFAQSSLSDATKSELVVDLWTNTIKSYYQTEGFEFSDMAEGIFAMFGQEAEGSIGTDVTPDEEIPDIVVDVAANTRTAYDYFVSKGFSPAAACGVLANIKRESNFKTDSRGDKVDYVQKDDQGNVEWSYKGYTSFGICQWHNERKLKYRDGRGAKMKKFCGTNWYNNLTGQLDFLMQELNGYSATLNAMRTCPNSKAGAKAVADKFVRDFERPSDPEGESKLRQGYAGSFWDQLVN